MSLPGVYNIYIQCGDTTSRQADFKMNHVAVNLTGTTIEWRFVKAGISDIVCTIDNGKLVVDSTNGTIRFTLSDSDTAQLTGRGRHSLKILSPYVRTILVGEVIGSA